MCGLLRLYSAISLFLIFRMFLFMRLINVVNASYRSVILLSPLLVEISTSKIITQKCWNVNKFFEFMPKNLIAVIFGRKFVRILCGGAEQRLMIQVQSDLSEQAKELQRVSRYVLWHTSRNEFLCRNNKFKNTYWHF